MEKKNDIIKWQKELVSFKGIKSTFIIEGNINDLYVFKRRSQAEAVFGKLDKTLSLLMNVGERADEYDLLYCDPLFGFSDPLNQGTVAEIVKRYQDVAQEQRKDMEKVSGAISASGGMVQLSETVRAAITKSDPSPDTARPLAVIVNFASRLVSEPDRLSPQEITMFLNFLQASKNAIRVGTNMKTLILVVDKINDIPAWFYLNNPNVRTITIPTPDRTVRETFVEKYFSGLSSVDESVKAIKKKFIDMTEGMKLLELDELRRLYDKRKMPVEEITDTVSIYKFGFKENKWEAMRENIDIDISSLMAKRVKGQRQALDKIAQIIKRSVTGLSGMQHSASGNKPRGIMFLAGPTGTGKTEVVKTVADLLFGDEKALIRFDMSEYTAEHADQKLFGAPPGYVGYDQGGQLTNAVKTNPFSILLFDEIEKAHTSIMDKFLQILEDGRMTDGQGNTVYFSETLIFFTSNAGISEEIFDANGRVIGRSMVATPDDKYDEIQRKVEAALKTKFKPEVLNRIGKNVIVFNYITEAATKDILKSQLQNISQAIQRKNKIEIRPEKMALETLLKKCLEKDVRENGGRGIGNIVESAFLNPLAEFIFDSDAKQGSFIIVSTSDDKLVFRLSSGA